MKDYPETTALDLCRLGMRAAGEVLRHPTTFDMGLVLHDWLRQMTVRHRSPNVRLKLPAAPMLLVTDREVSRHVLAAQPRHDGYAPGTAKRNGMSYLAPHALTIAEDGEWTRLRPFNEQVLCAGRPHEFQRIFLGHVRRAFSGPVASVEDIRVRMGRAMLAIVFGDGVAPETLAGEIRAVFGLVQNPVKRKLAGERGRRRVAALYDSLRRLWQSAGESSLLSMARKAREGEDVETLLQQVPHWMFTFTGSGSDLLTRGLAMIGSRPEALRRVRDELSAGNPEEPASIDALKYLEMHTPAAVILDLGLPRLHGSDVLSEMAAQGWTERTPVIVVTGERTDYLDASQFACVLHKPLTPDKLVATVRRCLSKPSGAQGI